MSKVLITIDGLHGKKKAIPPGAHAHPGEELEFHFKDEEGKIFFPHPELLFVDVKTVYVTEKHKVNVTLKNSAGLGLDFSGGRKHIFPYAAYCEDTGDFAEGNSAPVIIIEETRM